MARGLRALYTFVPISDGERAKALYRDVPELDLLEDTLFALIFKVPDGTRICWFRDPDGNLLSLTQTG